VSAAANTDAKKKIEQMAVNTIRTLSMDAVQAANSGHPGTPMAMAPVVYELWNNHLRFNPEDPIWPDRDRFVLSMGHASMLLYSILHLTQVKSVSSKYETLGEVSVKLDDIKKFRQLDSKCPGHPEYRWTSGIETTTGPLGQGFATSVGMAIAGKWMAAQYNKPGFDMFGYKIYSIGGDGCMMEGAASEAASLAGHLKLDNLCWIYDNNKITIEGETHLAFTEDVATRFMAYGWNVTRVGDANDLEMLNRAFNVAKSTTGRPTLIIVDSHIGWGSSKQDSHTAHGEPLGEEEIKKTKKNYGWPENEKFLVPAEVLEHFKQGIGKRSGELQTAWIAKYNDYKKKYPELADGIDKIVKRELPTGWDKDIPTFPVDPKGVSGRDASGKVLNAIAKNVPWLIGGSADLAPSTKTRLTFEGAGDFSAANYGGRNMHYGVRELAMGAILNGMALTKVRPYGSGFFVFSDFSKPTIRLAAIMEIPAIYIFTHDSIGVGEDGPTHQPIEHLIAHRAIPGLIVMRPGDANEVSECWKIIMKLKHEPVVLVLSRQNMPTLDRTKYKSAEGVKKGAYVLADPPKGERPEVILMATGTEVGLAIDVYEKLTKDGIKARVVSMPSWEIFEHQDAEYRNAVLPHNITARISIEFAGTVGWERYVGLDGVMIGMRTFGASAPLQELQKKFGFTPEQIAATAKGLVSEGQRRTTVAD